MNKRALRIGRAVTALIVAGASAGMATVVRAEDAADKARPPQPEKGTTAQSACIKQDTGWVGEGRRIALAVVLTNGCEARLQCRVFVYATSAKGAARGSGRLTLAPASKGKAATRQWTMPVKMAGGSIQTARECRVR